MTLNRIPGLGWNYTTNNHSWASGFDIFCWWFTQFLGSFLGWPAKAEEVDIGGGVLLSKGVNLHLLFSLLFHHLELSHPVIQVAWNTGKTSHLLWKKKERKQEMKNWICWSLFILYQGTQYSHAEQGEPMKWIKEEKGMVLSTSQEEISFSN